MTGDADNVFALTAWDRAVRRAKQKRRAVELVDRPDAEEAVRALSELDAYYAVKEIGPSDAGPILALLETEQIRTILDLDVWRSFELDRSDAILWLDLFREAGPLALHRAARAFDPEALAVVFARRLHLALAPREDASDEDPLPDWVAETDAEIGTTADRRFLIAARPTDDDLPVDVEEQKAILRIVSDLYRAEADLGGAEAREGFDWIAGVLRLAMTDSTFVLEEEALRFRSGRLEDLGFVPLERAIEVYAPADPSVLGVPRERGPKTDLALPAIHAAELDGGLFRAAMRRLGPEDVARIEGDLLPLANEILVADGVSPGAIDEIRAALLHVRGYLEIALSLEAGEDPEAAAERLAAHPIRVLFRVGYGRALALATRARAILAERAFAELLGDERSILEHLDRKRPRAASELGEPVPFDADRFRRIGAALDDLEALSAAWASLGFELPADPRLEPPAPERTADLWLTTAAARAVIDGRFVPIPFDGPSLGELAKKLRAKIEPSIPLEGAARAAVAARVARGLARVADALALVGPSEIDPRFVDGLVRVIARP
jgi:hypothetical protein